MRVGLFPDAGNPYLSWPGFEAPAQLLRIDVLEAGLRGFVHGAGQLAAGDLLRMLDPGSLSVVARRLLLGGRAPALADLAPLWDAHGTPPRAIKSAVEAASVRAAWKGALLAPDTPLRRGDDYAAFVRSLGKVEDEDRRGPLGETLRGSRYRSGPRRDGPILPGEYRLPAGFAVVLGAYPEFLRPAAWVHPDESVPVGAGLEEWSCEELAEQWANLRRELTGNLPHPPAGLHPWLHVYARDVGVSRLDSAGLAMALDGRLDKGAWPLPAGVGFTGRLKNLGARNPTLAGVTGLPAKLQAAREAGVFVLFACRAPDEAPLPEDEVEQAGVVLVDIQEGKLDLADLPGVVNRVCYELGLTEDRWGWESRRLVETSGGPSISSRPLPVATARDACPVGYVDRPGVEEQLRAWKLADDNEEASRTLLTVVGPARLGKTTLLAHWLQTDRKSWPRFPVWFSFVRHAIGRDRLADLRQALERQLRARYLVFDQFPDRPLFDRLSAVMQTTMDVVVDGLDEAVAEDQGAIVNLLLRLPGRGCVVLASQKVGALQYASGQRLRLDERPQEKRHAAAALVAAFSQEFEQDPDPCIKAWGRKFGQSDWQEGLAEQAGDNLWILTDYLRSFREQADARAAPSSPKDLSLSADVNAYCRDRLSQVLDLYHTGDDRDEVETLLTCLAILEDRSWPVEDILLLMGISAGPVQKTRLRRLLQQEVRRLLAETRGSSVRLYDSTFGQFLLQERRDVARDIARQLVALLARGDHGGSPFLEAYAAARVARHVLRDAAEDPHLAAELLLHSPWPARRFASLSKAEESTADFLREINDLGRLASRIRAGAGAPLDELRRVLSDWRWAIDQTRRRLLDRSGRCLADWWEKFRPPASPSAWPVDLEIDVPGGATRLLWPLGQVGSLTDRITRPLHLNGLSCEVPGVDCEPPILLLVEWTGDLVVAEYDSATNAYSRLRAVPLGVQSVSRVFALNPGEALVLATDWSGLPRLLRVDLASGMLQDYWSPTPGLGEEEDETGTPTSCAVLSLGGEDRLERVLVAAARGDACRLIVLEGGRSTGISVELPYRDPWLVVYAPDTWAVCEKPDIFHLVGSSECSFHRLEGGQIVTLGEYDLDDELPEFRIAGACPLPGNRFALTAISIGYSEENLLIFSREAELIHLIGGGAYDACDPIGCSSQRGLLLANIDLGGLKARPLEDEGSGTDLEDWLNREVPAVAERNQHCQGGTGLSDGSTLLVLPSGGLILKADGSSVVPVGEPERFGDDFDVLGVHEQGWLLVGEPRVPGVRGLGWSRDDLEEDLKNGFVDLGELVEVDLDELVEVEAGTAHPTTEPVDREGQVRQRWLAYLESKFHQFRYVAPPGTDWGAKPSAIAPFPGAHPPRGKVDRRWLELARPISRLNGLELGEEAITCYTDFGELVAVGYASRRVELFSRRATSPGLITPLALAFTRELPTSLSLRQRGRAVYLAVLAEQLLWFELTESVSNFSSLVGTGGGRT